LNLIRRTARPERMTIMEIERKFLVTSEAWREEIQSSHKVIQFYLTGKSLSPTVRLRMIDDQGYVTIKYPSISAQILARDEYEYAIPAADVKAQMDRATGTIIQKTRHLVKGPDGKIWEVDEFTSPAYVPVIAEIELDAMDTTFALPEWIGKEVTSDSSYSNLAISQLPRNP
jgi:adenylate cyclase